MSQQINANLSLSSFPNRANVVVTWSGGLDTTALIAYMAMERGAVVFPLFVNRGQENLAREKGSVRYFSSRFKRKLGSRFKKHFDVSVPIPAHEFKDKFPGKARQYYALRNSDIVNSGVRYALLLRIPWVAVGALYDDQMADISPEYWRIKNQEVKVATHGKVTVVAPFQGLRWEKSDVVHWCSKNGVDIEKSWTCWKGGSKQCGDCDACRGRKEAFRKAKVKDPTDYSHWSKVT